MWNIKNFLAADDPNVAIRVDPQWGFAEFPAYGDPKTKMSVPVLIDPEAANEAASGQVENPVERVTEKRMKEFWMPDKYCKVCYGCEEAFTMYRRRHHCRLCGQVFCNNCSSYFIEGSMLNMPGSVRACRPCYEQAAEQAEKDSRSTKRKIDKPMVVETRVKARAPFEASPDSQRIMQNLQNRASKHLSAIVDRLVDTSELTASRAEWKETIVNLVKEVVSSVDPDVRAGDSLDIRPYVKIKIIPGGLMAESVYIDGVVFRKNVAHKKMVTGGWKENPRILLIASGIEFQRTDMKLSSMDTLIEQEDKFMEILVQKLMSLKPDIILVGKAVARKAQELLCEHNVIVMQNVKQDLLERVARMTGAMLLPSTDNMVKQHGEECLGTCGQFWLRLVQDDPEKDASVQPRRVLRTRVSRGCTYAYIQGCPPERGCTIVLRGGDRTILNQVKQVLSFAVVVAYHLRLEVAYYHDRMADLPASPDCAVYDDSSDIDDEVIDQGLQNSKLRADGHLHEFIALNPLAESRGERHLLSTSLDVDFNVPFCKELNGTQLFRSKHVAKFNMESHQTLLITSLLMGEGSSATVPVQKSPADVKGIKYYTKHDIALGQFIMENCFQMSRSASSGSHNSKEPRMLDQTLSFVHRPGRIDISVRKIATPHASNTDDGYSDSGALFLSSFCKECGRNVIPQARPVSDETWKMSFGKFLEIFFYNRAARCQAGGCGHSLRDSHVLQLSCDSYVAVFEFVPIHPYSLHVRDSMSFPEDVHFHHSVAMLQHLPAKHTGLMDDFRLAMSVLEREIKDLLTARQEDLALAMADVRMMEMELEALSIGFLEDVLKTYECLPARYADKDNEAKVRNYLTEKLVKARTESGDLTAPAAGASDDLAPESESVSRKERDSAMVRATDATDLQSEAGERDQIQEVALEEVNPIVAGHFPATLLRNTFLRALRWNTRIDTIYRFLESVRNMLLQQQHPSASTKDGTFDGDDFSREPAFSEATRPDDAVAASPPRATEHLSSKDVVFSTVPTAALVEAQPVEVSAALPVGLTSLYRTAIEQNRRTADKPVDKMSRITKALSRFLAGNKDSSADETQKFTVPLGDFAGARYGLRPGRCGEVIAVSEEVLASVIAYALASSDYYDGLQASIHEKSVDQSELDPMAQDMEPSSKESALVPNESSKSSTPMAEAALNTLALPFKKKKPATAFKPTDGSLTPIPEEHNDEQDLDNEDDTKSSRQGIAKHSTYGLNTFMEGFSHEDSSNMQDSAFGGSSGLFADDTSAANEDSNIVEAPPRGVRGGTMVPGGADKVSCDTPTLPSGAAGASSTSDTAPQATTSSKEAKVDPLKSTDPAVPAVDMSVNERQMMSQDKSNIRVRFDDHDDQGNLLCKFQCQVYWAKQFEAVRNCYFQEEESRENYTRSLAMTNRWVAQGGKSGAAFAKTSDERMVIKVISKVELQMFLDFAPAYFEYMAKAYYHNLPTILCKILGIYTVRYDNKETGKKATENVVVMENIVYQRSITRTFDLKGSSRARYVELVGQKVDSIDDLIVRRRRTRRQQLKFRASTMGPDGGEDGAASASSRHSAVPEEDDVLKIPQVLLDDNLMEFTKGRPFPLKHRAKMFFHKAVQNDTLFLSIVNVVDYSILVGFDDKSHELTVGIIDYLRQYDIIKKMERVGKGSVGMLTGQAEPTIIQPSQYRKRFTAAMERYFMTVPDKWISYDA